MLRNVSIGRDAMWLFCLIILSLYILQLHRHKVALGIYAGTSVTPWTLKDRLTLSEKIYSEMLVRRNMLVANHQGELPMFPAIDAKSYTATPYSIWDLTPATFSCPWDMQRIGRLGDGGKWACGMVKYEYTATSQQKPLNVKPCVVYSFGVRDESSFEEEMLRRTKCVVWGYDPAVSKFGPQLSQQYVAQGRAKFQRAALAPYSEMKGMIPYYTLKNLMELNGHSFIDFLKIDIEFAEFASMTTFLEELRGQEMPVGQLLVEIHLFKDKISAKQFLNWWQALEQSGLRPVWTEPNLIYVTQHLSDSMPRLAEYTLININSSISPLLFE